MLVAAGRDHGLKPFGGRALNAMRIEKSFGSWAREYRPIYGPYEAGLGRFVDLKKGEFVGRAAALEEKESGGALCLVAFAMRRMRTPVAMSLSGTTAKSSVGLRPPHMAIESSAHWPSVTFHRVSPARPAVLRSKSSASAAERSGRRSPVRCQWLTNARLEVSSDFLPSQSPTALICGP
jgi:aminomethyltransferase folate-binding domain-containing protein